MKIHVVQKGETLWKIAQKYGVDFEELKNMNTQLSNPDMIMPGMKIKVPTSAKQVKKDKPLDKEMQKYTNKEKKKQTDKKKTAYKDMSEKAKPVIKEDDHKKPPKEKIPMKPIDMPKMPIIQKDIEYEKAKVKIPKAPQYEEVKESSEEELQGVVQPQMPVYQQPNYQQQAPVMPMYNCPPPMPVNPCCAKPMHHHVPYALSPKHHHHHTPEMYGVQGIQNEYMHQPQQPVGAPYPNLPYNNEDLMESSSSLDMPEMPSHLAGVYDENQDNWNQTGYGQGYVPAPPVNPNIPSGYQQQPTMPNQPVQYPVDMGQGYPYMPQQMQQPFYPNVGGPAPHGYPTQQMGFPYGPTGQQQPYYRLEQEEE